MNDRPSKRQVAVAMTVLAATALVLLAPIAVYIGTFGIHITANHARWGEMGSAMSGIYSPLLALVALFVVLGQLRSQNLINTHQMDQTHIEQSRADV